MMLSGWRRWENIRVQFIYVYFDWQSLLVVLASHLNLRDDGLYQHEVLQRF